MKAAILTASMVARSLHKTTVTYGSLATSGGYLHADYTGIGGPFGSIADDTYSDRSATIQTIKGIAFESGAGVLGFTLDGSVTNSINTFSTLMINGTVYQRVSATYTNPNAISDTTWTWVTSDPFIGSTETIIIR
jgi:hypothetical protein